LLAKEFRTARGGVARAVCFATKFFQLSGGDFSQSDNAIARK
jgi:hypothetical protein